MTEVVLHDRYTKILLSAVIFTLIGAYCILCSFFGADFALLHISLPYVEMPIFIGEIIFVLSLALTVLRIRLLGKIEKVDLWVGIYFGSVIF